MDYDIIVVGAGPAGLSFACSLKDSGLRLLLIEKQSETDLTDPAFDGRDLALTHLTRKTMHELGIWQRIPESSISDINAAKVLDGDSPDTLDFDAPKEKGLPLGYMISNHRIRKACYEAVAPLENVTLMCEQTVEDVSTDRNEGRVQLGNGDEYTARLVVAADTRFSETRRRMGIAASMRDFGHTAMVCRVEHEKPHNQVAWEIFQYGRTLAILPQHGNQSSVVLTLPGNQVDSVESLSPQEFAEDISKRFEYRLGEMKLITKQHVYPLVGVHAKRFYARRFALIGDAAVGMHPVTAHGFNLGLRGQATLADLIITAHQQGADIADQSLLRRYESIHMRATKPLYFGTNMLVSLFTDDRSVARTLRKGALTASRLLPPVRWMIQHKLGEMDERPNFLPPLPKSLLPKELREKLPGF